MTSNRPTFIDNRDGNTLAQALAGVLDTAVGPSELRVATAFFSPSGFAHIAERLSEVPDVRLMLGADFDARANALARRLGETPPAYERRRLRAGLDRAEGDLRIERDRLPFSRTSRAAVGKLIAALSAGNVAVRRFEAGFLHAKAYIFGSDSGTDQPDGVIAGSSNLTSAGLTRNLEVNLGHYDGPVAAKARQWFDDLWAEAEPFDLAAVFEETFRAYTPWDIFMRVLWQRYGDEVEEDAAQDDGLPLTSFQRHGVARALRLIRDTGGAIVADEVGLGKTFIAGEILSVYRRRRQRALLICPASVRDTVWRSFIDRFEFYIECVSFEQLAGDIQLRDDRRPNASSRILKQSIDEYQLVVVDEAHNYRNPDAPTRAAALRRLLFGARRDLLLLTATPVNNSLWDLYNLIRFFVRQDAHFADLGILSIRERFDRAMSEDPSSLSPDVLFPIIDATTVKRTREFVKKHYAGDTIVGPSGEPWQIVFPRPNAITMRYNLDELQPGFFDRVEAALDPESPDALSFHRYMPHTYQIKPDDSDEVRRGEASAGLLRSGLLKRFESSARAFGKTTSKMVAEHDAFLEALDQGFVVTTEFLKELSADDEAVFQDLLSESPHRMDAELYDVDALRKAVARDRDILAGLANEAMAIPSTQDPKLQALSDELVAIANQAAGDAIDDEDERQKRKVLIFSFFEDTVAWIRDFLKDEVGAMPELAAYEGRLAAVSGSGELADVSRQEAVSGFAPVSMEAPGGPEADAYDLLLATDVLAEGVNLQQCRHIINFDVPWNPMRLVQRHGRIDRIGSPHDEVYLRTVFPVDRLDNLLDLQQRIMDKLALAAASVGVVAPVQGARGGGQVFTETRDEIEKLLHQDATLYERGATASSAQTGEEYRQTLRKALAQNREGIVGLPRKIGSGMVKGMRRGAFFCAGVGGRTFLRFVPADTDWRVADEAVVREDGMCLRLVECEENTPRWFPDWLEDRIYDFWDAARRDILEEWMVETDPANVQPRVRPLNLRVAEFIRDNPPPGMQQARIERALDILESPWPRREEVMLRRWFESEERKGSAVAPFVVEQVLETGLEPAATPEPRPPIVDEDIELVCWMGIEVESD